VLPMAPSAPLTIEARLLVGDEDDAVEITVDEPAPIQIDTPFGSFHAGHVTGSGRLATGGAFHVAGEVKDGVSISVPGLASLDAAGASFELEHGEDGGHVAVGVDGLRLGPVGEVEHGSARFEQDATGTWTVALQGKLTWSGIKERLDLAQFNLPAPPDDGEIDADLRWTHADDGTDKLLLTLSVDLPEYEPEQLAFLGDYRPEIRDAKLQLKLDYADAASADAASTSGSLDAKVSVALKLGAPELPDSDALRGLHVHFGDESGLVDAEMSFELADGTVKPRLHLGNAIQVEIELPGLPQPEPPIHLELGTIDVEATIGDAAAGSLKAGGTFSLRPVQPPSDLPIGEELTQLLQSFALPGVEGTATLDLGFQDGRGALTLRCDMHGVELDLDVFALLSRLTTGMALPPEIAGATVGLHGELGASFTGFTFSLGSLTSGPSATTALVELDADLNLFGARLPIFARLSDRAFEFGAALLDVPLKMPRLPIAAADLPTDNAGWDVAANHAACATEIAQGEAAGASADELVHLRMKQEILAELAAIRERVHDDARPRYQMLLATTLDAVEAGLASFDSDLTLRFENLEIRIPFSNPRQIGVDGTGRLIGIPDGASFVKELADHLRLKAGIATDTIFFALETVDGPLRIPIHEMGRYRNGYIEFAQFTFGFGWARRSLVVSAAGAVRLPDQVREDIDAAALLGVAILPPHEIKLSFRLDLIPVPMPGTFVIVIPVIQFDVDLRDRVSPGILATSTCEPFWDGVELKVPGVVRSDLKHFALSPFFGPFAYPNVTLDFDYEVGDEQNGYTIVCDQMMWVFASVIPYPATWLMFVDNLCVDMRIAGFRVNANLQAPLPSASPFALFELIGLIADPMMRIKKDGALANTLRVSITDAKVTLPEPLRRLFPGAASVIEKEHHGTVNLGTYVTAAQKVAGSLKRVVHPFLDDGVALETALHRLVSSPPDEVASGLLELMPPELRKIAVGASFAGFEGRAMIVLVDPADAAEELGRRGRTLEKPPLTLEPGQTPDPGALRFLSPDLGGSDRVFDPADPTANAFAGLEFAGFGPDDLAQVPAPRRAQAGVVVAAHVKVFAGQRYRFLGAVWEDGSFALISAVDVEPLRLRIAGMAIELPLELDARLTLAGRVKRDGNEGSVRAEASARWTLVPGKLELDFGRYAFAGAKPGSLELRSDGTFSVRGVATLHVFGMMMSGSAEISPGHVFVDGGLSYASPAIDLPGSRSVRAVDLTLDGRAHLGPGDAFELDGRVAKAEILGVSLGSARVRIARKEIELGGKIDGQTIELPGGLNVGLSSFELLGRVELDDERIVLEGDATLNFLRGSLDGHLRIECGSDGVSMAAAGALRWGNHAWVAARVTVDSTGVVLSGRTTVELDPPSLPGGALVAGLTLRADLDATVSLNHDGTLRSFDVDVAAMLALQAAGDSEQRFPLAIVRGHIPDGAGEYSLTLPALSVPSITFPDLGLADGQTVWEVRTKGTHIPVPWFDAQGNPSSDVFKVDDDGNVEKRELLKVPGGIHLGDPALGSLPVLDQITITLGWNDDGFYLE
jgi:hypothetical protein